MQMACIALRTHLNTNQRSDNNTKTSRYSLNLVYETEYTNDEQLILRQHIKYKQFAFLGLGLYWFICFSSLATILNIS